VSRPPDYVPQPAGDTGVSRGFTFGVVSIALLALLVGGMLEIVAYRRALVREISTLASAIGHTSHAALLSQDSTSATALLKALSSEPSVEWAALRDSTGHVLATYQGSTDEAHAEGAINHDPLSQPPRGHMDVDQPIEFQGRSIGTIRVVANLDTVWTRLRTYALLSGLMILASTLGAFFWSARLQRRVEDRLYVQANYDALTGLPNRLLAIDRLRQALGRARRDGTQVALFFVDLDRFKFVNDTLGHAAGDSLLVEASYRIAKFLRESDTLARLGGDEFVVILPDVERGGHIEEVARRILESLATPILIAGREVTVSASIGITVFPDDGQGPEDLFRNADAAMYGAKNEGRNTFNFFTPDLNDIAEQRLTMETRLRRALDRGTLAVHYQPLVELDSGRVMGAEALLRWTDPELGYVPPNSFIPLAEETGLIVRIGAWVIREACTQMKEWQDQLGRPLRVAVNISPRQIQAGGLPEDVKLILEETGLPPECLELEITERLLLIEDPAINRALAELRALGVRLSMDDFGTGYSALAYLRRFRFDTLKVDKMFVQGAPTSTEDASLTAAIAAMAASLGLQLVGEGVETEAQGDNLRGIGCDLVQGYLFGRPAAPDGFLALVRKADEAETRVAEMATA